MTPDLLPRTEDELERYLRQVEKLREGSNFQAALEACQVLVDELSTRSAGLRARADVHADMRNRELELADRKALVDLGSKEPSDYFDLGVASWKAGLLNEAIGMFEQSIRLGEEENFHYYTNVSRMHLAALLIKLHRRDEALRECKLIPKDYSSYLPDGMTTREQLLEHLR